MQKQVNLAQLADPPHNSEEYSNCYHIHLLMTGFPVLPECSSTPVRWQLACILLLPFSLVFRNETISKKREVGKVQEEGMGEKKKSCLPC